MRNVLLVLCTIVTMSACVDLNKPEKVAECAHTNSCVNAPIDAGPSQVKDARADGDGSPFTDGRRADGPDATPGLDGPVASDDGPLPEDDGPIALTDGEPSLPEVAGPTLDGSSDGPPVIVADAPTDRPVGGDDAPADTRDALAPDTRDANRDVAAGACAPGGVIKPAGTVCRAAVDVCDVDETCDGVSADCPTDQLVKAGKECRAAKGDCDIAETCTGTKADCPTDGFKQSGTVCRAAAGVCDYAEVCSGTSATCPNDSLKQSSAVCRDAVSTCDPAESCTGLGANCPTDVPAYARPAAPATAAATAGELQASLTWSAVTGATGYSIKRGTTAGGPYTTIATAVAEPPFVDTGLDSTKTYYYVVSAVNTLASCESAANSPEASVTPTGICTKPAAPTVTATAGNGQVSLSWATIAGATAYAIDRSEASGTGYASLAQVLSPTISYVDTAVTFGKTYYYRVTAKSACDSDPSTEVSAAPLCAPAATAPTGLAATTPNTGGIVVLTWNAVAGAKTTDRYYIMRKTGTGAFAKIDEAVPPAVTYSDTTAVNGTAYSYAVTYYNGTCTSGNSNVVTATATCVMDKPVLTATAGNKKVDLAWTQPANGSLTGYEVYRKTTGSYTRLTSLTGAGSTSYSDTTAANGTTYTYYVRAKGACDADSDPKTAAPVCTPLAAPANPRATAGNATVTLSWDAVTGADHYTVKRGTAAGGPYTALTPASPITTNSYTDTALTNGTTYYYVVTVSNGTCDSTNSAEASAMPQVCPSQGAPGTPTLTITSSTQVKVDWAAATPAPSRYNILRSDTADGTYASVGDVEGTTLTLTDSSAAVNTTYYYQVAAVGALRNNRSASASIAVTCSTPAAPSPSISAAADGKITLTWSAVSGATSYMVLRGTAPGGPYTLPYAGANLTGTTYTDTGLTNATTYYYVVTASNANGVCVSPNSAEKSARSCIIPAVPTGVSARRTGNKQVTVAWTNSTGAGSYYVQRSDGTNVRVTTGSPYQDTGASNGTAYTYVLSAASDTAGVCSSGNTSSVSVPTCKVFTNGGSDQKQNDRTEWCLVTCDDVQWWSASNAGDRTLYINSVQTTQLNPGAMPLPAKGNGGYAFYFTASPGSGAGNYTFWNYGSLANHTCP